MHILSHKSLLLKTVFLWLFPSQPRNEGILLYIGLSPSLGDMLVKERGNFLSPIRKTQGPPFVQFLCSRLSWYLKTIPSYGLRSCKMLDFLKRCRLCVWGLCGHGGLGALDTSQGRGSQDSWAPGPTLQSMITLLRTWGVHNTEALWPWEHW